MREELLELAGAGCAIIQMEEPNIHLVSIQRGGGAQLGVEFFVDIFNSTVKGLRDRDRGLGAHVLGQSRRSNVCSQPISRTSDALPYLNQLDVDVITFECCTSDGMDLEIIGKADHRQEDRHRRRGSPQPAG